MSIIETWREPKTRAVSIYKNPGDFSTDNGVLFTVVALRLGLIYPADCDWVIWQYEPDNEVGSLLRHPSSSLYSSWDDHLAFAMSHKDNAVSVLIYMESHGWKLPNDNWLGRIPLFVPAVRAAAGESLGVLDQIRAAGAYLANCFEKREETSGKQLLWLANRALQRHLLVRVAIAIWKKRMMDLYPRGLRDLMAIYYTTPQHPFREAAALDFSQ